ncbi:MAG: asparagine synthase (glutamine-hydrolyzing) [Cytophagaceae bacterium]|nr:asparagine synthase (glutamine-hydrolyzing) [Cytophagaceae bacterium]
MCGILGLINKKNSSDVTPLLKATHIIDHRGPDDEGFLLWEDGKNSVEVFAGSKTAKNSREEKKLSLLENEKSWKVGLGHKRLSILDLSPAGHQPMVHGQTGISISYNGEVYNYIELRKELEQKGYTFHSGSDTEVLLNAWVEWGTGCLPKLNGMFSFLILDPRNGGTLYAVRDRFGVKPLYWYSDEDYLIFCSEIKQIRILPNFKSSKNEKIIYDYLAHGLLDHSADTFDTKIKQMQGGEMAIVPLSHSRIEPIIKRWYTLTPKRWEGSESEATAKFLELFSDSIRLRLRADVPVGSCLSGGLDSSAIVCIIHRILNELTEHSGQVTVTACYDEKKFDEWEYANEVIKQTAAQSVRVFPDFERLKNDLDIFLWHQDEPFGSTSQFSQYCVFDGAAKAHLKVMVDGQGSDEQLAGYGGNELSLFTGLLRKLSLLNLLRETQSYKRKNGSYPKGFLIGAIQNILPDPFVNIFPEKYKVVKKNTPSWLKLEKKESAVALPKNLKESLQRQVLRSPLPSLLRYEDRNSMAWSIESRVPFMDYRFVEFNLGLPEKFVFSNGVRKVILRKALSGIMPDKVLNRTDKMGFVSPEEVWLKQTGSDWFLNEINQTLRIAPEYFHKDATIQMVNNMIAGKTNFNFTPWRILCLGRWLHMINK